MDPPAAISRFPTGLNPCPALGVRWRAAGLHVEVDSVLCDLRFDFILKESDIFPAVHRATSANQEPNQLQIPANVST